MTLNDIFKKSVRIEVKRLLSKIKNKPQQISFPSQFDTPTQDDRDRTRANILATGN